MTHLPIELEQTVRRELLPLVLGICCLLAIQAGDDLVIGRTLLDDALVMLFILLSHATRDNWR